MQITSVSIIRQKAIELCVSLSRVQANLENIRNVVNAPIIAVVKADAYGLGIERVLPVLADGVEGFCVFSLAEATAARIWERTGKPTLALGPGAGEDVEHYLAHNVRPAVWDVERAAALRRANPVLSVDTGMQRFACPAGHIDTVLKAGGCQEAFTHATSLARVGRLMELVGHRKLKLHAAGSALLHEPEARLDAVRPGLALYAGAARVSTRLVEERKSSGPIGYTGFTVARHGVILAGYSNGLRPGPCVINGRRSRVIEVGMQSAFVETSECDRVGDEVVLLGDGLSETEVATAWQVSPQEVLVRLVGKGGK